MLLTIPFVIIHKGNYIYRPVFILQRSKMGGLKKTMGVVIKNLRKDLMRDLVQTMNRVVIYTVQ